MPLDSDNLTCKISKPGGGGGGEGRECSLRLTRTGVKIILYWRYGKKCRTNKQTKKWAGDIESRL